MSNQNEKDVPGVCSKTGKRRNQKRKKYWLAIWLLPITGLLSLLWFLVRVIPKPNRAAYPCMRVAAPMASTFLVWLFGLAGSIAFIHGTRSFIRKSRYVIAVMCFIAAVGTIFWSLSMTGRLASADADVALGTGLTWTPSDPANTPVGTARGIHPGRVVWAYDPDATSWDGDIVAPVTYWKDYIDQAAVTRMVSRTIQSLGGENTDSAAWGAIFKYFNQKQGRGSQTYADYSGKKIAIKINLIHISSNYNLRPGNASYPAPQLVYALLKQLVDTVGVTPSDITVYDASQAVPDEIYNPCSSGSLAGVRFVDKHGGSGRIAAAKDNNAKIYHANEKLPYSLNKVPTRWMPQCVSQASYIINLATLKSHFLPGITVCAKNHFGSTWVAADSNYSAWKAAEGFWPGRLIHDYINAYDTTIPESLTFPNPARPMGSYNPLVELMGSQYLGEKTVLFMLDGIYIPRHVTTTLGGQDASDIDDTLPNGPWIGSPPWGSEPFDGDWSSMILASQDGVAIDSVALDFLRNEPNVSWVADLTGSSTADDYLHEAAQADNPPSGAFYDPDNDGDEVRLPSLGTHEHWNNNIDKQYSRNLGTGDGIELVKLFTHEGDVDTDRDVDGYDLSDVIANWLRAGRIPSGLVGYWKMDHDDGDTTAVDSSGNGNDGTCVGGTPGWVDGMIDGAIDLDGAGEYVNLGQPSELDFGDGDFTIAAWFKTSGPNIEIYDSGATGATSFAYVRIHRSASNVTLKIDDGINDAEIEASLDACLDNRWHHIVLMREGSTLYAYVDAVPHGTAVDCTSVGSVNSGKDIWIGKEDYGRAGSNIKYHDGLIDDVAVFNRALTIEEVQQLHLQTGDINQDRQIDMIDIALLGKDWGKTSRP